jgi:hypothetical protein
MKMDMFLSRPYFGYSVTATSALKDQETFDISDPRFVFICLLFF